MAAAGFGTAQLFEAPRLGLPRDPANNPPETFMWGTKHWADRIKTALEAARDNDMTIGLQVTSGWPWSSPAVAGENVDLSAQKLVFAQQNVTGPSTFVGPPPEAGDPAGRKFLAVTAARRDPAGKDSQGHTLLDPESTVNLTSKLDDDGNVHWDVPAGDWVLFGFYHVPSRSEGAVGNGVGYVIDYLNRESNNVARDFLDENLFAHLGDLPRVAGDVVHEDNLEALDATPIWSPVFLSEFKSRRGYDLRRYLPGLTVLGGAGGGEEEEGGEGGSTVEETSFNFPGGVGERIRHDYAQTVTELWVDSHVNPTRRWANGHGLESAGRAFGADDLPLDVVEVAKHYDVPDADHITNPTVDFVRTTTSGAHISGNNRATSELGDLVGRDYMITLDTLKRIGERQFVGGANQLDLHGFPYQIAHGSVWPSWWPWSSEHGPISGVSDGWSPNMPLWRHLPRLASYFSRAQTVLQSGKPVMDVAVYRDSQGYGTLFELVNNEQPGDAFEPLLNSALTKSGFNFDIVNPETVEDGDTRVEGKRLIVQRPGYKGLVIDLEASRRTGKTDNSDAMGSAAAWRLVHFADAGLPIVFVKRFPDRGVSYRNPTAEDARLRSAVARLKSSPNVRLAATEADVPAALAELGVEPDLSLEGTDRSTEPCGFGAQCVYSVHRRTDKGDYWFVHNMGDKPEEFTGSFAANGRAPQMWDLWKGDRREVGLYRNSGDRVNVPIQLAPLESVVIGFEHPAKRHVVETDAEKVIVRGDDLYLRSTNGDNASATLSDGRKVSVNLPTLPSAVTPAAWQLHVDGAVPEGVETHDLELSALKDWREIPELKYTSGTGTYRTTVNLSGDWVEVGRGAYLDIGRVEGGVQVTVNGKLVHPVAVAPSRLDVGPFLREGSNVIEVEVTTTLRNRLTDLGLRGVNGYQRFGRRGGKTQPYGLIGPVKLIPYAERAVPGSEEAAPAAGVAGARSPAGQKPKRAAKRLSIAAKPKRDRQLPFKFTFSGRLTPASGVKCSGKVNVRVKRGNQSVARKTSKLSPRCEWKVVVSFKSRKKLGKQRSGTLRATARYSGNAAMRPKSSKSIGVRFG